MALFKRSKKEEKIAEKVAKKAKKEKKKEAVEKPVVLDEPKKAEATKPVKQQKAKSHLKIASRVLKGPQITEKATKFQSDNKYIFKVTKGASKSEIKKAVEEMYGVKVIKVHTINVPRKKKRLGRTVGFRDGYRKAIVSAQKGQDIEILPR